MKLSRLELSGFKSFADRVELHVDDGITAIVGPNGCGKSNISDAVRWVLGEQRPSLLRSARMDEVIFQGAASRRPVNVAEMTLYFDNDDGTLNVPYREVAVTRRLTRSGLSEYLLNQTPVRLRDLHDLLQGTGLGSDAGVVIELRMVDRLLSDRAEERRSLFEEAAGIGLYRDRKASTERRLEKTTEDLGRLDDVIAEVRSQVRSLARQRGKAERYDKFTCERLAVVMTLTRRELAAFDEQRHGLEAQRDELAARLPQARAAVAACEREREAKVQERATALARGGEVQRRLGNTQLELQRLEGNLKLASERLEHAAARKARAGADRAHVEERAAQAARELEAAAAERRAAEEARTAIETELGLRTTGEEEVRGRCAAQRARVRELEAQLQQQAETHRALEGARAALERELEDLRVHLAEEERHCAEAERELEGAAARAETARAVVAQRASEERDAAAGLERTRQALGATREQEGALRHERHRAEEMLTQCRARHEALVALEQRREGLAPAARALLAARHQFGDGTILGPLSDFVDAPSAAAELVERLLADSLHAVLVRDQASVDAVRQWHATAQPGPLVLLPVDPGPRAPAADASDIPALAVRPPAEAWVAALLAGTRPLDADGRSILRVNGAVYLAGRDAAGPLSRRAEMERLERELAAATQRVEQTTAAHTAAARAHTEAEGNLARATERLGTARTALLEAQGQSDDATRHQMRAARERSEAEAAQARLSERLAERRGRLDEVEARLASGSDDRTRLEEALAAERAALAELEAAQEAARERRVHWQVEEAQAAAREQAAREREARGQTALDESRREIARLDGELAEIAGATHELSTQRLQWAEEFKERRVAVQELETAARDAERAVEAAEQALGAAERALEQARAARDQLTEDQHRLELQSAESDGRRRALVERIEGEWRKPLDLLLREAPEVEGDSDALKAEAERLAQAIEALGPVNPLAMEEHLEELKRLEFLSAQRDDLAHARDALQQALREIDQTARAMFLETFEAVQANFRRVFTTLFDGGDCDVRLADKSDPLESPIEIHAAPRGKRTQRIHLLSSGERALVAISLLFAIYLARPAPFCLLDEVDAPLDDANVMRFVRLLDEFKSDTQFIVITHNPRTMQAADAVYGVTMQEPGVSSIVGVRLGEVERAAT